MAIEFHCPYCTAAVRVADSAAGKRGTCPKCAQKVMVPLLGEATAQPVAARSSAGASSGSRVERSAASDAVRSQSPSADAPPDRPGWFSPSGKPKGKAAQPRRAAGDAAESPNGPPGAVPIDRAAAEVDKGNGEPPLPVARPVEEPPLPVARPVAIEKEAAEELPPFLLGDPMAVDEPIEFDPEAPLARSGGFTGPSEDVVDSKAAIVPNAAPAAAVSYARKLKRRTRRKQSVPWTPIVCIGLLLGVLAGFAWWGQGGGAGGALAAEPLENFVVPTATVESTGLELPQATISQVLDELRGSPRSLRSKYMWTEFQGSQRGLRVRLAEGDETMFYRVNVAAHSGLRKHAAENASRFDEPRKSELDKSAVQFFKEWEAAPSAREAITDLKGYRDTLGLPALVGPLGYHAVAEHDGLLYRCVYEDPEGNLYFLLPPGVTEFTLRGRQLANDERLFTKSYTVKVSGQINGAPAG
ncbi:MAG: hypothetical protein WD066_10155 [Planctomycetaceae bacterium]